MNSTRTSTHAGFRRFIHAGDSGVIVSFADEPDMAVAMVRARRLAAMVRSGDMDFANAVLDVIPGFNNIIIQYDPVYSSSSDIIKGVEPLLADIGADELVDSRHWIIPVLYGGEGGPDLEDVAEKTGFPPEEVISRHLSRQLTVAIMGFMPGLGYLKGIDPALTLPRRSSPRKRVPALTLGIAMDQSVIYPLTSPGGWNLIGKVPVRIFEPRRDDPILFRPGDRVSFRRVDDAEFTDLNQRAEAGETILHPASTMDKGEE